MRPHQVLVFVMAAGINYNNVWADLGRPLDVIAARRRSGATEDFHVGGSRRREAVISFSLRGEFCARHPALHLLVNNAGPLMTERQLTSDGREMTLGVNHIAPFLLTNLLRAPLFAGAPSRVVNVASDAHRFVGGFDFDDPMGEQRQVNLHDSGA
jgi:NAD(P)-dependent dehydrogenase (short-subunit alcohol dehydrogenase family)